MYNNYSFEISKIFKDAENIMLDLNHPYVGTEHLLLSLLKNSNEVKYLLQEYDLTYDSFLEELNLVVGKNTKGKSLCMYTPLLKRVINLAEDIKKDEDLKPMHLLLAMIEEGEGIAIRIMIGMDIDIDKIYEEIKNSDNKYNNKLEIYKIGKDFQEYIDNNDILVGRDNEINLIIETLIRKNKNNPLLIGEAGVGKTAIVEELARRINKKEVPAVLRNKRIVSLEMSSLVAGTKYRGEFEEKLGKVVKELEDNPDIILFIDEIHTMSNAGGAEGAINASDILKPYLARGKVKVIGATTIGEYNKYILKDKALNRRFEIIKITEPNINETINILNKIKPLYENHYNIKITEENIKDLVNLADKYILNRCNPDKSIDLLDSICAMKNVESKKESLLMDLKIQKDLITKEKIQMVKSNKFDKATDLRIKEIEISNKIKRLNKEPNKITLNDIKTILYRKINIPVLSNQSKIFNGLKKHLNNVLVGQREQINVIINNLKNHEDNKPLSLLLTGSTGVGKTKCVKEICEFLHIPLVRLDMSEYNADITVNRLIGSSAGYVGYDDETIFDKVKINPYSCILLDEIEKAHPSVLNLFLQILDEGFVTNTKGEKIDFKNTYIFMTSNAKVNKNIGFLKNNPNYQNNFSKEFLGRINEVIAFNDVNEEMIKTYLNRLGITDINVIKEFDYHNQGFRGLDRYLKSKKIKVR